MTGKHEQASGVRKPTMPYAVRIQNYNAEKDAMFFNHPNMTQSEKDEAIRRLAWKWRV